MAGGTGNDIYYVDNPGDVVTEATGEGTDRLYTTSNFTLSGGSEVELMFVNTSTGLVLSGNELNNSMIGAAGNDTLLGGGGDDIINGGLGVDSMAGGTGNDVYYVDNIGDVVTEAAGEGIDKVYASVSFGLGASSEVEFLNANAGAIGLALTGNSFANHIIGAAGADTLDGGAGADTLVGGLGADLFAFHSGQANGDIVSDFLAGTDKLQFVGYGAGSTLTEVGASNVWHVFDGVTHTTESITFTNAAHPGVLDYSFV